MAGKGKVERRGVGVLYAELRNFTRLSEVLDPAKVMELANEFFMLAARHMSANSGRVLAVHNDSMLGIFTAAADTITAAQAVQLEFPPVGERWQTEFGLRRSPSAPTSATRCSAWPGRLGSGSTSLSATASAWPSAWCTAPGRVKSWSRTISSRPWESTRSRSARSRSPRSSSRGARRSAFTASCWRPGSTSPRATLKKRSMAGWKELSAQAF
jgi:hypothetical protein